MTWLRVNIIDGIKEIQPFAVLLKEMLLLLLNRHILYQLGNTKYLNMNFFLEKTAFNIGAYYFQMEFNQYQFLDF